MIKKVLQITLPMRPIITIQETLRPALPVILGCKEYRDQEQLLKRIDLVLKKSGIEGLFVSLSRDRYEAGLKGSGEITTSYSVRLVFYSLKN